MYLQSLYWLQSTSSHQGVKDSRVICLGDKDQILSTGFNAVSCCFIVNKVYPSGCLVDSVTYFQVTNDFHFFFIISWCLNACCLAVYVGLVTFKRCRLCNNFMNSDCGKLYVLKNLWFCIQLNLVIQDCTL